MSIKDGNEKLVLCQIEKLFFMDPPKYLPIVPVSATSVVFESCGKTTSSGNPFVVIVTPPPDDPGPGTEDESIGIETLSIC